MKKYILSSLLLLSSSFAFAYGGWTAVAYDQETGNYGYSYEEANKETAERAAFAQCKSATCEVIASYKNGHIVLALSKGDRAMYGVGWGSTKDQATHWAYHYCNQGPSSCRLILHVSAFDDAN